MSSTRELTRDRSSNENVLTYPRGTRSGYGFRMSKILEIWKLIYQLPADEIARLDIEGLAALESALTPEDKRALERSTHGKLTCEGPITSAPRRSVTPTDAKRGQVRGCLPFSTRHVA